MTHPDLDHVLAFLDADSLARLLGEIVDIPSPTGHEAAVAHHLVAHMRRIGMEADLQWVEAERPNAVGHLRGRGTGLNLLFTGHMDTSYSGDEPYLVGEGFQPKSVVRDGWMWGLGVNNMKSGLACALVAIEAIIKSGIRLDGDISFGAVVGEVEKTATEEFTGRDYSGYGIGSRHLVLHGVTADAALLAEPTGMRVAIANLGCIWARITLSGTVAHSAMSNRPGTVNAVIEMHELQTEIVAWARDYEQAHIFMGERPNVTFAAIRGGAAWRLSRNPHECSLYLDIRTVPGQSVESVKRELRRVLKAFAQRKACEEPGLHFYVTDPPTVLDDKLPIVEAASAAQVQITGKAMPPIIRRPGADAVHFTNYGVPCIAFGPGGRLHPDTKGASMHAFGEHVLLDDCLGMAKTYVAIALDLCSRPASD